MVLSLDIQFEDHKLIKIEIDDTIESGGSKMLVIT